MIARRPSAALLISLGALFHAGAANALEWEMIPAQSDLRFEGSMLGVTVIGVFERFEAEIEFDPENPAAARIEVRVDMTSVDSRHSERDTALLRPEWFDAKAFPEARFTAREAKLLGDGRYEAPGELSIKGNGRAIALPFTLEIEDKTARATGAIELSRKTFSIGTGDWADDRRVAYEVIVRFDITARRSQSQR